MANSKIYLGNINIGSLFQGADDISIYLGNEKVYPLEEPTFQGKWLATYSDSSVTSAECDSSSGKIVGEEISKTNLVSVEVGDCVASIGVSAFTNATSIEEVVLPEGLTLIDFGSFKGCTSLTSVTIPSTVTVIGTDSFSGCTGLLSITFLSETPIRVYTNTFYDSTCPIYVPAVSVEDYKAAQGWSTYASRIQAIP